MPPAAPVQAEPTLRRFIDFTLSLQSVIAGTVSVACFMVWMGYQAAQTTNASQQTRELVVKLEKRFDDKDSKIDDMREKQSDQKSTINSLVLRVEILERARK